LAQSLSTLRKTQLTRSAIHAIGAAVHKTHGLQLFHNLTGVDGNDSNRFG